MADQSSQRLIFVSAGDLSGDTAASRVLAHLPADVEVVGLGGPRMRAQGQHQLADFADLAVMGFWEVAKHYLFFRRLMLQCVAEISARRPRAVVLVDYPGFNLRLAARIKHLGIPILYYISPQVWAWGKRRVKEIRELIDRMLVILPFEEAFFNQHGIQSQFVGHYLLEDIPESYIASPPPKSGQIAVLPGSRTQEVERLLPAMARAAERLSAQHTISAVVAGVEGNYDYESVVGGLPRVRVEYGRSREIVHGSDIALVASGTATLETGIIGRPMLVAYRTGWITFQIARRLVKLDNIALINLVLGETVVPELIQHDASAERMYAEAEKYLTDTEQYDSTRRRLNDVVATLGGQGASRRVADVITEYL